MFVVPKKKHKRANKRNDIKRRMREVYRLNKNPLYESLKTQKIDLMFICLSNEELEYPVIEKSMLQLMETLGKMEFLAEGKRWSDIHRLALDPDFSTNGIPAKMAFASATLSSYVGEDGV